MTVNFGFKKIKKKKKETMVQGVFSKVADKYDIMNDIMSFGLHRKWKDIFINEIDSYANMTLLDLAGGTGDIRRNRGRRGHRRPLRRRAARRAAATSSTAPAAQRLRLRRLLAQLPTSNPPLGPGAILLFRPDMRPRVGGTVNVLQAMRRHGAPDPTSHQAPRLLGHR